MSEVATATPEVTAAPTAPSNDWRATLPEDIRAVPELQKYASVADLAKGHVEQSKLVGRKGLEIPGPDAKPEQVAAFHKALGVPESPDKYDLKPHPVWAHPDWNREAFTDFLKEMHASGAPPAVVQKAADFYANFVSRGLEEVKNLEGEARAELRKEWGANYEPYLGAANRGLARIEQMAGLEPGQLTEAVKGTDPLAIAKAFFVIESQFVEHGFVRAEPIGGLSPDDVAARIADKTKELLSVPENSDRAKAIIDEIAQLGKARRRAA